MAAAFVPVEFHLESQSLVLDLGKETETRIVLDR